MNSGAADSNVRGKGLSIRLFILRYPEYRVPFPKKCQLCFMRAAEFFNNLLETAIKCHDKIVYHGKENVLLLKPF